MTRAGRIKKSYLARDYMWVKFRLPYSRWWLGLALLPLDDQRDGVNFLARRFEVSSVGFDRAVQLHISLSQV